MITTITYTSHTKSINPCQRNTKQSIRIADSCNYYGRIIWRALRLVFYFPFVRLTGLSPANNYTNRIALLNNIYIYICHI